MKRTLTILLAMLLPAIGFTQSPDKISYQAVIRDADNKLVSNHEVGMRISILQDSINGAEIYKEIYNPNPQTNANGLITLNIGSGIPVTGHFKDIQWAEGPYFLKTEVDPSGATNYNVTGTSQFLSVPYAFHSNTADSLRGSVVNGIDAGDTAYWNHKLNPEDIQPVPSAFNVISLVFQNLPAGVDTKIDFTYGDGTAGTFIDGNTFSLSNDEYTAPASGFYFFESLVTLDTRSNPPSGASMTYMVNGSGSIYQRYYDFTDPYSFMRLNMTVKLTKGDVVSLNVQLSSQSTTTMGGNSYGVVRWSGFKVY